MLQENILVGQRVEKFRLETWNGKEWKKEFARLRSKLEVSSQAGHNALSIKGLVDPLVENIINDKKNCSHKKD